MQFSKQFLILVSSTSLIFIGYLNTCYSDEYGDSPPGAEPKIWPNISDNHSFLQWPGLTGSGGLDIDFYEKFSTLTKGVSQIVGSHSNYTLIQIAAFAAIGGFLTGISAFLAQAQFLRIHDLGKGIFDKHKDKDNDEDSGYGAPPVYGPPHVYGAPPQSSYGAPSPPNQYGAPNPPPPPAVYGSPNPPPPSIYGAPSPAPSTYGVPSASNEYGAPNPPTEYGAPSPPSSYGR